MSGKHWYYPVSPKIADIQMWQPCDVIVIDIRGKTPDGELESETIPSFF